MKRLCAAIIILLAFAIGSPASAQTSTPTPGPICGVGYYEQNASCVIYSSGWTTTSIANASGGSYVSTTTVGANLTFRMYGTSLVIYRTTTNAAGNANFCVDASCQTISFNSGGAGTLYMQALAFNVDCLSICTVTMTNNVAAGSVLDSFQISANLPTATPVTPLPTWTSQVITPLPTWTAPPILATWTNQVPTAIATWTAQPYIATPLPTWTAQGRSQYILTNGLYEEFDAGLNFVGAWSPDYNASYSDGFSYITTSQSSYLSFTIRGRFASIGVRKITTGDDIEVCVTGGTCTVYDANGSNAFNSSILIASPASPLEYTVIVRKAANDATPIYIDRVSIQAWATETPLPTWTAFPTPVPQFTQIAPLTQIPYPTPPPYLTQIPPLTEVPQFTEIPQFTQIAPLTQIPYPTPLETWTAQPGGFTPLPTWTPYLYPTPLDTWTPQAVAMIVVTMSGSSVIDWNGLLTVYPSMVTQVPASSTPTETMTPSITFTPSVTPTETPAGYIQLELPNAEGTVVATGTLYMQATAGEVGGILLLFFLSLIGLIFIVMKIFEGRKSPV